MLSLLQIGIITTNTKFFTEIGLQKSFQGVGSFCFFCLARILLF